MTDRFITVTEAARIAQVTQQAIHYWINTGRVPARRSRSTNPTFIKRSDLIAALPKTKIKTFNEEHGVQLKTLSQIAKHLNVSYQNARHIVVKTGTTRHKLFKNDRETYVDIGELFEKMSKHRHYYALVPSKVELRRLDCGCDFCLMDS